MLNSVKIIIGLFLLCWIPSTALTAEVTYYHTDALGTPMAMTDSTGKVVWKGDYYPFGEEYLIEETPEKNKRHFTGKEKDVESGLHYFGARYMDEVSGRFVSPDPVTAVDPETSETNTAFLENPLRLNRYVYGLNNPYRYIDPDGEFAVKSEEYVAFKNETKDSIKNTSSAAVNFAIAAGAMMIDAPVFRSSGRNINKSLGANPFKGKSFQQVDKILSERGFIKKGAAPSIGKGSYINNRTGRKYYLDSGGKYKKGTEAPHVDVHRMKNGQNLEQIKRKYPIE